MIAYLAFESLDEQIAEFLPNVFSKDEVCTVNAYFKLMHDLQCPLLVFVQDVLPQLQDTVFQLVQFYLQCLDFVCVLFGDDEVHFGQ